VFILNPRGVTEVLFLAWTVALPRLLDFSA
jgi:hypothetical protein